MKMERMEEVEGVEREWGDEDVRGTRAVISTEVRLR